MFQRNNIGIKKEATNAVQISIVHSQMHRFLKQQQNHCGRFVFELNAIPRSGAKEKKPSSALFSPVPRVSSPLWCLTSVFGMETGVSTTPKPPDFFPSERPLFPENRILSRHALQVTVFTYAPDLAYSFIKMN